jgi:hypothetical protein
MPRNKTNIFELYAANKFLGRTEDGTPKGGNSRVQIVDKKSIYILFGQEV